MWTLLTALQIAAEESVLQMIPAPALSDLIRFQKDPTEKSRAHLLSIPAIYNVLKHHETQGRSHYPADLLGTIEWVIVRVIDVMSRLITPSSPLEPAQRIQEDPWQEVRYRQKGDVCVNPCFRVAVIIACRPFDAAPAIRN